MQTEESLEQAWRHTWNYHQIGAGQQLLRELLSRLGKEWCEQYHLEIWGCNGPLQSAYVKAVFRKGEHFGSPTYYLRDYGYTGCHHWECSGRASNERWFSEHVADERLKEELERLMEITPLHTPKKACLL